jgi:anti-sigma factor RsiW
VLSSDGMSDALSSLSERELAELSALADGTLPPERLAAVEARVAASAELRELVERQRQAVAATQSLADEPVPESVLSAADRVRRTPTGKRRARRFAPGLALAGAVAAAAVVAALVLSGGPGAPSVAEAARLSVRSPSDPAPVRQGNSSTKLAAGVQGVAFPYLARLYGWRAVGFRHDKLDGRSASIVYYAKGGRQIAYVIVSGSGLTRPAAAQGSTRAGVEYQTLRINGRLAVTWRRGGHTCVLIGEASRAELLKLASWPT